MNTDIYIKNGYANRSDYLSSLADEYDLSLKLVEEIAALLGPSEDFDGLITELQDFCDLHEGW